jgi:hypothetical protein
MGGFLHWGWCFGLDFRIWYRSICANIDQVRFLNVR